MSFKIKGLVYRSVCMLLAYAIMHSGVVSNVLQAKEAFAADLNMPVLGSLVKLSENYDAAVLRGIKFDPANPFKMDFIVDQGNAQQVDNKQAAKLVRYFLTALTVPEDKLWVNLSPYESDRILDESLADTEVGETLLKQDYLLKQLSSSLTYPETKLGQKYWNGIAGMQNSSASLNKIWISTDKVELYDGADTVFIKDAVLKVQTEADYHNKSQSERSNDVISNVLLPAITRDVNKGRNFSQLRQLYYSSILAQWFKKKFAKSLYSFYYNTQKTAGVNIADPANKENVFNKYVEAFEQGVYNYTRKEKEPNSNKLIKKNYFSGGANLAVADGNFVEVSASAVYEEYSNRDYDQKFTIFTGAGQVTHDDSVVDLVTLTNQESNRLFDSYEEETEVKDTYSDQDIMDAIDELTKGIEETSSSNIHVRLDDPLNEYEQNQRYDPETSNLLDKIDEIDQEDIDAVDSLDDRLDNVSSAVANMPDGELKYISQDMLKLIQQMYDDIYDTHDRIETARGQMVAGLDKVLKKVNSRFAIAAMCVLILELIVFELNGVVGEFSVGFNDTMTSIMMGSIGSVLGAWGVSRKYLNTDDIYKDKFLELYDANLNSLLQITILGAKTSQDIAAIVYAAWDFIDKDELFNAITELEYNPAAAEVLDYFSQDSIDIKDHNNWKKFIADLGLTSDLDTIKNVQGNAEQMQALKKISSSLSLYLFNLFSELKAETDQQIGAKRVNYSVTEGFVAIPAVMGLLGMISQILAINNNGFDKAIFDPSLNLFAGSLVVIAVIEFVARFVDNFKLNSADLQALERRIEPFISAKHIKTAEDLAFISYFCANLGMQDRVRDYVRQSETKDDFMYRLKKEIKESRDWELEQQDVYKNFIPKNTLDAIDKILTKKSSSSLNLVQEVLIKSEAKAVKDGTEVIRARLMALRTTAKSKDKFLQEFDKVIKHQMIEKSLNTSATLFLYALKDEFPIIVMALLKSKDNDPKYKDAYNQFVGSGKFLIDKSAWAQIIGPKKILYLQTELKKKKEENSNEIKLEIVNSSPVNDLDDWLIGGNYGHEDSRSSSLHITDQDGERIDSSFLRYSDEQDAESRSEFESSSIENLQAEDLVDPEAIRNRFMLELGKKATIKQKLLLLGSIAVTGFGLLGLASVGPVEQTEIDLQNNDKSKIERYEDTTKTSDIHGGVDLSGALDDVKVSESTVEIQIDPAIVSNITGLNFRFVGQARQVPLNKILGVPARI